jgi:fucose permease
MAAMEMAPPPPARSPSTEGTRGRDLKILFTCMAILNLVINLDGGAVPAALIHISRTFELTTVQEGLLGMLVYQGIALGSLTVGPMLARVSPRRATQVTVTLNTLATMARAPRSSDPARRAASRLAV